jgi:hypothetical protein
MRGYFTPVPPKTEMTILFIILGIWLVIALLMVCALVAAARRPACFDPDAPPVHAVAQENSVMNLHEARNAGVKEAARAAYYNFRFIIVCFVC